MKQFKFLSILLILSVLGSCTKYEEGSNFSIIPAKARLVNHWTITKYEIDGVNQPINQNTSLEMDFYKDNTFKRTWVVDVFQAHEEGSWTFADGKNVVVLTKKDGGVEAYTIIQLKVKDFKAKRTDGSSTYVYTFKGK